MGSIFNMFAPSPIRPLEQHMRKAHQCAKQLYPFLVAALAEDWEKAEEIKIKIIQFEEKADSIKREMRLNLPSGLFLPVARTDLLETLSAQDKIANKAEDIALLVTGRKMRIPAQLAELILPFLNRSIDASNQACKAINELDELLESGFRGSEVNIVEEMIMTLDKIEQDCDKQLSAIQTCIIQLEKELPPIEVVFLYKLVQWIGDLADHAQTVGGRLQILIAR